MLAAHLRAVHSVTERRDASDDLLHRLVEWRDDVVAAFEQQDALRIPRRASQRGCVM